MKKIIVLSLFVFSANVLLSQSYYFPPLLGKDWATTAPEDLGWCTDKIDSLYNFLEQKNSKAFLVLKDGKIVLEKYFGSFTQDSIWYWASAGKTLTGLLTGIAQQQGYLSLDDQTSKYLGKGWTNCTQAHEDKITIRHQLCMTTGLDDSGDTDCYLPSCLTYKADAGTRWAYHNAPYTLLDSVIESATGKNFNLYSAQTVKNKTGMTGLWVKSGYNNVFYSNARSMARFGSLLLNKGAWNGTPVLNDTVYFNNMTNSSQDLNKSYGYLTWLNGKEKYMLPGSQIVFNGPLMKDAPLDMFAAMGKNGQIINISPSKKLIVIRIGNPPNGSSGFVPNVFNNDIWKYLNAVICKTSASQDVKFEKQWILTNNPVTDILRFNAADHKDHFRTIIFNMQGRAIRTDENTQEMYTGNLPAGMYYLKIIEKESQQTLCFIKQ